MNWKTLSLQCSKCGCITVSTYNNDLTQFQLESIYQDNLCAKCFLKKYKMLVDWNEGNVLSAITVAYHLMP